MPTDYGQPKTVTKRFTCQNVVDWPLCHGSTAIQEKRMRCGAWQFLEMVTDDHHRHLGLFCRQVVQCRNQRFARRQVEPDRRLVQEEKLWPCYERSRDPDSATLSLRAGLDL